MRSEQQVYEALMQRQFRQASQAVATYEAQQVFPRGLGMDWANHDPTHDAMILDAIFTRTPQLIAPLHGASLDALRIAAGMQALFARPDAGKPWLPARSELACHLKADVAARMLLSPARYLQPLDQYRWWRDEYGEGRTYDLKIHSTSNSCAACVALSSGTYTLEDVPELPHEACTHEWGCGCVLSLKPGHLGGIGNSKGI